MKPFSVPSTAAKNCCSAASFRVAQIRVLSVPIPYIAPAGSASLIVLPSAACSPPSARRCLLHRKLAQRPGCELWVYRHGYPRFSHHGERRAPAHLPHRSQRPARPLATLQLAYTVPSHGSVKAKLPNAPWFAGKNCSIAAISPSSSSLSWISQRCSAPGANPDIAVRCHPRTAPPGSETARALVAGYCATALVFSLGKVAISEVVHYIVDRVQIQHRVAHRLRNVAAAVHKRLRVHRLHVHRDLRRRRRSPAPLPRRRRVAARCRARRRRRRKSAAFPSGRNPRRSRPLAVSAPRNRSMPASRISPAAAALDVSAAKEPHQPADQRNHPSPLSRTVDAPIPPCSPSPLAFCAAVLCSQLALRDTLASSPCVSG